MNNKNSGFTLIEIAIVLVIIGLLLGGVLKGQELINNARVRNIISQQDSYKAAFFAFQDRFRALPGDYVAAAANANIGVNLGGNGDSLVNSSNLCANESTIAWVHLARSGFISGNFAGTCAVAPDAANSPTNAYGGVVQIIFDNLFSGAPEAPGGNAHNIRTGRLIPVGIISEIDRKLDDGFPNTGIFRFSTAAPADATCIVAGAAGAPATWNNAGGSTNCGGAYLF